MKKGESKYFNDEQFLQLKEELSKRAMSAPDMFEFLGYSRKTAENRSNTLITSLENKGLLLFEEETERDIFYSLFSITKLDQLEEGRRKHLCLTMLHGEKCPQTF